MATNENLEYIKEGLSTQEQILGQAIAGERFVKKHKNSIIAIVVIAVLAVCYFAISSFLEAKNLEQNTALYNKVLKNPKQNELISELKAKNINLFALFAISEYKNGNKGLIDEAIAGVSDKELRQILLAIKGEKSELMSDYDTLKAGFEALNSNNIAAAKLEFSKIPENSSLKDIAKILLHYQGIKQ